MAVEIVVVGIGAVGSAVAAWIALKDDGEKRRGGRTGPRGTRSSPTWRSRFGSGRRNTTGGR